MRNRISKAFWSNPDVYHIVFCISPNDSHCPTWSALWIWARDFMDLRKIKLRSTPATIRSNPCAQRWILMGFSFNFIQKDELPRFLEHLEVALWDFLPNRVVWISYRFLNRFLSAFTLDLLESSWGRASLGEKITTATLKCSRNRGN